MDDAEYVEENRKHWDELAEHHPGTSHYDVESLNGIADRPGWAPEEWRDDR